MIDEKQVMKPAEFADKMKTLRERKNANPYQTHLDADDLMCELLRSLGYGEGVEMFELTYKWYAQ